MAFSNDHDINRFPTRQRGNFTIAIATSRLAKLGIEGHEIADLQRFGETFRPAKRRGRETRAEREFARTDEAVIPQRSEFLERRIPRDQQPHSATVLNGRPQQPHQLDELLLRLRFLPDDFFEPLELIQTRLGEL